MRVLLIAGGWSNERDVSLSGANGIAAALKRLGHEFVLLDPATDFDRVLDSAANSDFAFLSLHGSPGEDGLIQAMLDAVGCPYQGAGPAGSFLALNKAAAKQIFRRKGLDTPNWEFLPLPPDEGWTCSLHYPLFVKSNIGGSSLDMGLARGEEELRRIMPPLFAQGHELLLEEAVRGVEITCAVLGETPLPPIRITPLRSQEFFDYQSKYAVDGAEEICPAPISDELTRKVQELSLAAHRALGLRGYSRSDFILDRTTFHILETNTLPGMTPTSLLPRAAAAAGFTFDQLIARLIELGSE